MKKHLLTVLAGLGLSVCTFAQISEGGLPTSFAKVPLNATSPFAESYHVHELVTPDLHAVHIEDAANAEKGNAYRVGINIPVSYNIHNSGTWLQLENGDKI